MSKYQDVHLPAYLPVYKSACTDTRTALNTYNRIFNYPIMHMEVRRKMKRFINDTKGFTGLEAAIVLTAFVVVAAVFSYVVLGAGFFTTDTAKQVVHTGVEQATSSVVLNGDVVADGNITSSPNEINEIIFYLQLSAGRTPVDIKDNTTVISYEDSNQYIANIYLNGDRSFIGNDDGDTMLDPHETAKISLTVSDYDLVTNEVFTIQVKPPVGAVLPITRTIPGSIDNNMVLI